MGESVAKLPADKLRRLLVGYRDDDVTRYFLPGEPGGIKIGRCVDCRHPVFVDRSGVDCLRDRDPVIACHFCATDKLDRYQMVAEL